MHVHIALFRWKASASGSEILEALNEVASLADKVPGIVEISCAENQSRFSEGYTHVVLVRGESQAAIDAYRAHPDHVAVAQRIDEMEEAGVGVDFETKAEG